MKTFILFAPRFLDWPLALIRHVRSGFVPDLEFCGLATGGSETYRRVRADPAYRDAHIDELGALEAAWLRTDVTDDLRKTVLSVFSHGDLNRILISDRNVGWGYVTGADFPMTPLMEVCARAENAERYILNLCSWIIALHETRKFNSCLCYAVAGAPGLALELFCARKRIPFVRFLPSRVGGITVPADSSTGMDARTGDSFRHYAELPDGNDEHVSFARQYLERYRIEPQRPGYAIRNHAKFLADISLWQLVRRAAVDLYAALRSMTRNDDAYLRKPRGLRQFRHNLTVGWRARRLATRWPYDAVKDIGGREFVYYPLHVDPEASTMVLAPMFTDQVALVEALSKATPLGMTLVVKEHLPMLGRRPRGFYDAIRRLPNVLLVSPFEDGFDLISRSSLVAVITGTAAWEAMLLGRPALIFGHVPFACIGEGFVRCTDLALLPERLAQALALPPASHDKIVAYIATLHRQGFEFNLWQSQPSDLDEARRNAVLDAMSREILCRFRTA